MLYYNNNVNIVVDVLMFQNKIHQVNPFDQDFNKLKLKNDIVADNIITWDDVEFNINDETISYRKKMESQIND